MDLVTRERPDGAQESAGAGFIPLILRVLGGSAFMLLALLPAIWSLLVRA